MKAFQDPLGLAFVTFDSVASAERYLSCLLYQNQRVDLINTISRYTQVTLQVVLCGSNTLPLNANNTISKLFVNISKKAKDFNAAMN